MAEVWANDGQAVVSSGGTDAPSAGTVETWTLTGSTLPVITGSEFFYAADDNPVGEPEKFLVTANNGTTATVVRGADGTTPVVHTSGFSISQVIVRATLEGLAAQSGTPAWFDVTSYGATGNGTTDDTTAIQAAITAAEAATQGGSSGAVVYFPFGKYKISSALSVTGESISLIGDGAGGRYYGHPVQVNQTSTTANGLTATNAWNIIIKGIAFTGPGSGSGIGISLSYTSPPIGFSALEDVYAGDFGSHGVYLNEPIMTTLTRVWSDTNGGYGFYITGSGTSLSANSCWASANGSGGWYVTGGYNSFSACGADGNTGAGWTLHAAQNTSLSGCGAELNTTYGLYFTASCYACTVNGFFCYNTDIGIQVDASCYRIVIAGYLESPSGSPAYSIQVASGAIVTLITPQVSTAKNLPTGFCNQILDNGIQVGGPVTAQDYAALGLTGATAATRWVGATTSGAPASGTFAKGDFTVDQTGAFWVCTTAGTPGTWTEAGGGGVEIAGDLGGTDATPAVVSTHLTVTTLGSTTSTQNLDPTNTRVFHVTQSVNTTYTFTSGLTSGISYSFELYLFPGTYTTSWPGSVTWIGGTAPTLTASALNLLVFETTDGGTTWYGSLVEAPALPLTVPNGGTGGMSFTAYQVLAGGTSSTSPVQAVAAGVTGQYLQYEGASALPAWTGLLPSTAVHTSGFTATLGQLNPADATSGSITATLPGGAYAGQLVAAKMINTASGHTVTVQPTAPDVLGRVTAWTSGSYSTSATLSLTGQGQLLAYNPPGATSAVTVTASSASLTISTSTAPFAAGQLVFFTAGTMPTGLTANTVYYVVSTSGPTGGTFTFQVAATSTGSGIAPSTAGSAVLVQTCGNWTTISDDLPLAQLETLFVQSVTAGDTSIVVGGTATAPTLETGTLDVIAADHPPAANWSNNSHKITSLSNGSASSDAAAYGQTLAGGDLAPMTTEGDLIIANATPAPARLAIGSAGQILTPSSGVPAWAAPQSWQSVYTAPTGATAETYPRYITTGTVGGTSAELTLHAIGLPAGLTVTNITMCTGGTGKSGGSHGWYCILDSSYVLRGVTADQTDSATTWAANAAETLALASPYVTTYAGLYYLGVLIVASGMPIFCCTPALEGTPLGLSPILGGNSNTGLSTPGTVGSTTYTAPTNTGKPYYAYTS